MRGRSCTQPFLVEKSACRPDALLLPPRWANRSPPHPTRLRRPTYGLWWLRLDPTEQSPGLFDPRGEGFGGGNAPSRLRNHASQPAQLGGGPLRAWDKWAAGQAEKEGGPPQGPPNQSRESRGEKLSPLALFPPVSREKRGPPPGRRPTGRCAPRLRKSPDHPKGTPYRPPPPRRGLFLPKALDKGSLIG